MASVHKPSFAFMAVSWAALLAGVIAFLAGLWNNSALSFNDKGFFFAVLTLGLFAAISVQKIVRDRIEGVPFTTLYYGLCWVALIIAVGLLIEGLLNIPNLTGSEKGFYAMACALAMFGAVTVQKNTRDTHTLSAGIATQAGDD